MLHRTLRPLIMAILTEAMFAVQDIAAKEASGEMEKQKTVPVFKDMVKPGVLDGVKKSLGI